MMRFLKILIVPIALLIGGCDTTAGRQAGGVSGYSLTSAHVVSADGKANAVEALLSQDLSRSVRSPMVGEQAVSLDIALSDVDIGSAKSGASARAVATVDATISPAGDKSTVLRLARSTTANDKTSAARLLAGAIASDIRGRFSLPQPTEPVAATVPMAPMPASSERPAHPGPKPARKPHKLEHSASKSSGERRETCATAPAKDHQQPCPAADKFAEGLELRR